MYSFSSVSLERLKTCHPSLVLIAYEVLKEMDVVIICGARSDSDQQKAYKDGFSKLDGVVKKSKHQISKGQPFSLAIDMAPYPVDWQDLTRFKQMGGLIKKAAKKLNLKISWGGDWKTFKDFPHTELI